MMCLRILMPLGNLFLSLVVSLLAHFYIYAYNTQQIFNYIDGLFSKQALTVLGMLDFRARGNSEY